MVTIQLRRSSTPGSEPSGLNAGEPAVNTADGALWIGGVPMPIAPWLAAMIDAPWVPSPGTTWRSLWLFTGAGTTIALTAGRCYFIPFYVLSRRTITNLGIEVSAASAGSAEVAIYASDPGRSWRPGSRLAYVSGLDTGTTGVKSGSVSITLPSGMYWAALRASAAATLRGAAGAVAFSIVNGGNNRGTYLYHSDASLASLTSDPATIGTGTVPHIYAMWS